ncbi:MAG: glycosyltransferase family 39 protein, partial [Actinomycetota bacterium]|nr:glycosyltransferase family 39 protein [Actinomycetota bacterium]
SGVIGADRIAHARAPWGNFPVEGSLKPCGPADAAGEIRERIQTNGRCESANPQGDTYGPVAYESYIPGYLLFGWSGRWDSLPAVHFTSIAFDLLCMLGLWLVGRRFGGAQLGAALTFAWAAYPFTQYASNSNTNDAIMPCFLIWGFWLVSAPVARGALCALSGLTKFASLIVAPLWLTYPGRRPSGRFIAGFAAATLVAFSVVLFEPSPLHELRVFWDRTVRWQIGRDAPWSIWDWGQYHARGLPNLHVVQRVLQGLLVAGALVVAFVPRRKSPLQLAALTAALLAGFELCLTYWLYTYIPWFFPFAAIAVLAPLAVVVRAPSNPPELDVDPQEFDPGRQAVV